MRTPSNTARLASFAAVTAILVAACGGSIGQDARSSDVDGQSGVVFDTTTTVESAVAESTTTVEAIPEPDTTTEPTTPATDPPATAPAVTEPAVTAPAVTEPADTEPANSEPTDTESVANESDSIGVPVGYRPLVDDTGTLQAHVPAEWFDTEGAGDGEIRQLAAAPDLDGFLTGYSLPGMLLISGDAPIPDAWTNGLSAALDTALAEGCEVTSTEEYDDGVYTGTEHLLSCGAPDTAAHLIGGRDEAGEFFFLLAIVRPVGDVTVRDEIVESFFID